MTPDYTDPHLKLTTATRALIQQAKASGQSCTDATRQAEEALRGVDKDEAAKVAEQLVKAKGPSGLTVCGWQFWEGRDEIQQQAIEACRKAVAAALRDFASAEVAKARKEWETPPVTPVAFSQLDEDSQALAYAERMVSVTSVGHIDIHGNGLGTVVDGGENAHGKADFLKRILARALAGYAFHRQSQQQPKPVEQPPAVEGDDPWKTATFANLLLKWENSGSDRNERLTALQSYCRSAARAAEERAHKAGQVRMKARCICLIHQRFAYAEEPASGFKQSILLGVNGLAPEK